MDIKKIMAKLPSGFAEDVEGYSKQKLKDALLQSQVNIRNIEQEREEDEKLRGAKEILKDLSAPYKDAIGAQKAKIAYILHILDERGEAPAAET